MKKEFATHASQEQESCPVNSEVTQASVRGAREAEKRAEQCARAFTAVPSGRNR